jgi:hypothetical protein
MSAPSLSRCASAAIALSALLSSQHPASGLDYLMRPAVGSAQPRFVANRGQWHPQATARATARGLTAWLSADALTLDLRGGDGSCVVAIDFVNGYADAANLQPGGAPMGADNYCVGPVETWRYGVPAHAGLLQRAVWPGVDLVFCAATAAGSPTIWPALPTMI